MSLRVSSSGMMRTAGWSAWWLGALLHALRVLYGYLIGEAYEDELVAFTARKLMVNDSYRDRLLAPEIHELVELCDALRMTIPQRKAYFRCFLHLDSMRRAGVSRAELLRYCGLQDTPVVRHLLPGDGAFSVSASTHRSTEFRVQRWDVVQFLALMFSVCTMDAAKLVDSSITTIVHQQVSSDEDASTETAPTQTKFVTDVQSCLAFNYGALQPVEHKLGEFVGRLSQQGRDAPSLLELLRVLTLVDVTKLFPVLMFPAHWCQRVLKRRILGEVTWSKLASRRVELQLAGLEAQFVAPSDIVNAARVLLSTKPFNRRFIRHVGGDGASLLQPSSPVSTPRRVLPVDEIKNDQACDAAASDGSVIHEADAWRVTADSVLACAFLLQCHPPESDEAVSAFLKAVSAISAQHFPSAPSVQRMLIQEYGYQFTTFIFAKSSLGEQHSGGPVANESIRKQQRRASMRYRKADEGLSVVEDKAVYWKEYTDQLLKRVFYHNIRTGESRWEMPSTVLASKHRKRRRRSPTRSKTA